MRLFFGILIKSRLFQYTKNITDYFKDVTVRRKFFKYKVSERFDCDHCLIMEQRFWQFLDFILSWSQGESINHKYRSALFYKWRHQVVCGDDYWLYYNTSLIYVREKLE